MKLSPAVRVWFVGRGSNRGGAVSCKVIWKNVEFLLLLVSLIVMLRK